MSPEDVFCRYQELQAYVGWTEEAAARVASLGDVLRPHLAGLIDDFYDAIERHPQARKVITGGAAQIERLKGTLTVWLQELLAGRYDHDYVARRWKVGWRHVEIGLDQVYTNVALSRLRSGLVRVIEEYGGLAPTALAATLRSLNQLLDLDLAIIEDAYQYEFSARLQRGERLASIGQVAGGIAHELRNPLNVIKTSVYYLLNARSATEQKKAEHLQRIERHVALADGVVTALSSFARMPVPNLQSFPLRPCLEEVLEINPVPATCEVVVDCPPSVPPILADLDQVRIVFGNLVRNAHEAMPHGGRLGITARQQGDHVEISVSDTGVGISPDQLSRILEPLYSTKARGLGLGLAIARSILEKNQGSLRATSEPGRGSTFTVLLRAVAGEGGVT